MYNFYFFTFTANVLFCVLLWLDVHNRPEFANRPRIFLTAIAVQILAVGVWLPFLFFGNLFNEYSTFLFFSLSSILYYLSFFLLEYSIHSQRIRKSFLEADFFTSLKMSNSVLIGLVTVFLISIALYAFRGAMPRGIHNLLSGRRATSSIMAFKFYIRLIMIVFTIGFVGLNTLTSFSVFNLQEGVIRKRNYPFVTLIIVQAVFQIIFFTGLAFSRSFPFYIFTINNLIFLLRAIQEYFYHRTDHLLKRIAYMGEISNSRNDLMERIIKSPESEDIPIIRNTIEKTIQKINSTTVVNEYNISGWILYSRTGDTLSVSTPEFVDGYCCPLSSNVTLKRLEMNQLVDMVMKQPYRLSEIERVNPETTKDFGAKCMKTIIETKENLIIEQPPSQFRGLQRLIAFFPIFDKEEIIGVFVIFKDSFNRLLPEEQNGIKELIDYLRISFSILEGKNVQKERNRLQGEMDIAKHIQESILPPTIDIAGYDIAASMNTATEVGGDVYDFIPTKFGNYLGIGDVSGHGLPAGMMALTQMAAFHGAIRASERLGTELKIDEIYETVNQALCTINKDRIGSDKFMTQNYLKETNGQVAHSGTHEIALLYKKNADTVIELKEMTNRTGFLGLSPLITAKMSVGSFDVQEGDILVLYSDGVIEAKDKYGHQYGLDRVKTIMKQHAGMRSQTIIDRIIESLEEFAKEGDLVKHKGKFTDDITLVVMKKEQ